MRAGGAVTTSVGRSRARRARSRCGSRRRRGARSRRGGARENGNGNRLDDDPQRDRRQRDSCCRKRLHRRSRHAGHDRQVRRIPLAARRGVTTTGAGRTGNAAAGGATGGAGLGRRAATVAISVFDTGGNVRKPHQTLTAPTRNAAADGITQRTTNGRQRKSTDDSRTGAGVAASASSSSLRNCSIGDRPAAETASSSASMSLPDGGGTGLDARRFATTSVAASHRSIAGRG